MYKEINGIVFSLFIAVVAVITAAILKSTNIILVGLILGIVVSNIFKLPESLDKGISFTSTKMLELSIIFLAFSINFKYVTAIGGINFILLAIAILLLLVISLFLVKVLKCPSSVGWLIGFGTAICGSSAIAALSTSIPKEKEDVGMAMAVVNLYGSIGMLLLPFIFEYIHLNDQQMGFLIGGSLHSVGNVAGAGYGISKAVGDTAITVKLARVALLTPYLIFFKYMLNKYSVSHWKEHFKLPWYLIIFILITILTSFINIPKPLLDFSEQAGKYILALAMVAIGLKVSFKKMISLGKKGILFGLMMFLILLLFVSLLISLL
ncbi:MAG: putative sulfate exporter family transporter [Chitinophagaceae bacterium]|nr:putative sulfate exporter family transporter [Chitinophagaceae bacterium]HMN33029.1 putative sulfate exporter family transporter [Chitinophagaceae bacterium]